MFKTRLEWCCFKTILLTWLYILVLFPHRNSSDFCIIIFFCLFKDSKQICKLKEHWTLCFLAWRVFFSIINPTCSQLCVCSDLVWSVAPEEMKAKLLWSAVTSEELAEQDSWHLPLTLTAAGVRCRAERGLGPAILFGEKICLDRVFFNNVARGGGNFETRFELLSFAEADLRCAIRLVSSKGAADGED